MTPTDFRSFILIENLAGTYFHESGKKAKKWTSRKIGSIFPNRLDSLQLEHAGVIEIRSRLWRVRIIESN